MDPLLFLGIAILLFVGYNIGGATTAPAFAPAVGANLVSKVAAGALMSACFFLGAWTLGRRVVSTLGSGILGDPRLFTLRTSVVVLGFVGLALFAGNRFGVPSSTSMTTVGAITGLGLATGQLNWTVVSEILVWTAVIPRPPPRIVLNWTVVSEILVWWVVGPIIGFAVTAAAGRYLYPTIADWVESHRSHGRLLELDRSGTLPRPRVAAATTDELVGGALVVAISCLMAFSSGTSNIANAVAPLVGGGDLGMNVAILLGSGAVAAGALTIARRTLDTLGNEISALPMTAAAIVAPTSATLVIALSALGIPASFVIVSTACIAGIGWGRSTRTATSVAREPDGSVPDGGTTDDADAPTFDPVTTARVILMQNVIPVLATVCAYLTFRYAPVFGP